MRTPLYLLVGLGAVLVVGGCPPETPNGSADGIGLLPNTAAILKIDNISCNEPTVYFGVNNDNPHSMAKGQVSAFRLSTGRFDWFCGNDQKNYTCPSGSTLMRVSVTPSSMGDDIYVDCANEQGSGSDDHPELVGNGASPLLYTSIQRCSQDPLRVHAIATQLSVNKGQTNATRGPRPDRADWECGLQDTDDHTDANGVPFTVIRVTREPSGRKFRVDFF